MSRFQLAWAVLMFVGIPAMTLAIALLPMKLIDGEDASAFPARLAIGLYLTFLALYLSPKIAGVADILLTKGGVARYGGAARFWAGALIEVVFSFLLGAVTTFRITVFMVRLAFGKSIAWNGQAREAHAIGWRLAARALWPVTAFGVAVCGGTALLSPATFIWSLPLTLGYLLAIPFAVATASPRLGAWFAERGLCAIPEEVEMPPEIAALHG
jgi:membrane glycosyltransferase